MDKYTVRIDTTYLSGQTIAAYAVEAGNADNAALKGVNRLKNEGTTVNLDAIALHVRRHRDKAYSRLGYDQATGTVRPI